MEKILRIVSIIGVFLGIAVDKVLINKYGVNASTIMVGALIIILLILITALIFLKYFLAALGLLILGTPLIISFIGMYLDNLILMMIGVALMVVVVPVMKKVLLRLKNK
ncbi:hypothetical protein IAI10_17280 [Clostridium sp. 19966]|uniref:hypothetical protein n=1 Tax=Clostridium sp. 19966 TaxID=2768166 RepID=UPI0028DE0A7C|nr:hypothetical protein [Clostridium sp. 19966]MDT8718422.1 hypothetical protein [Clostridium sp. 19966]